LFPLHHAQALTILLLVVVILSLVDDAVDNLHDGVVAALVRLYLFARLEDRSSQVR
jgi:hypothetical protein